MADFCIEFCFFSSSFHLCVVALFAMMSNVDHGESHKNNNKIEGKRLADNNKKRTCRKIESAGMRCETMTEPLLLHNADVWLCTIWDSCDLSPPGVDTRAHGKVLYFFFHYSTAIGIRHIHQSSGHYSLCQTHFGWRTVQKLFLLLLFSRTNECFRSSFT